MKTETTHTKEPWKGRLRHDPLSDWGFVRDEAGETILIVRSRAGEEDESRCRSQQKDPTQPRTDRVIECVNACAGIPDPAKALEKARENIRYGMRVSKSDTAKKHLQEALALLTPTAPKEEGK